MATTRSDETDEGGVVEEDWSHLLSGIGIDSATASNTTTTTTAGDNNSNDNNNNNHHEFSYYDTVSLPLSPALAMELRCVQRLTPLDMLDLSNGERDATGNRVWMGAVFFLECMVRTLPNVNVNANVNDNANDNDNDNDNDNAGTAAVAAVAALTTLRRELFQDRRVLELGCGTGASLIAIGLAGSRVGINDNDSTNDKDDIPIPIPIRPRTLVLTDNDPKVLALCEMNCRLNFEKCNKNNRNNNNNDDNDESGHRRIDYTVERLDWGEFLRGTNGDHDRDRDHYHYHSAGMCGSGSGSSSGVVDTVVATDVIYDVAAIPILFATATKLLVPGGCFVLAHVPRASVEEDATDPAAIQQSLEARLLASASEHGLVAATTATTATTATATTATATATAAAATATATATTVLGGRGTESDSDSNGNGNNRLGSSLGVLCRKEDAGAGILRPSTIAKLWKIGENDDYDGDDASPVPTLVSGDYDYDDLESCGASILVFAKRSE